VFKALEINEKMHDLNSQVLEIHQMLSYIRITNFQFYPD